MPPWLKYNLRDNLSGGLTVFRTRVIQCMSIEEEDVRPGIVPMTLDPVIIGKGNSYAPG